MKKVVIICAVFLVSVLRVPVTASAQCSICTKSASQLGEKPAKGLNSGILYLMAAPFFIAGYIGYRWWKREQAFNETVN